jgi:hypothetical protein
VAVEPRPGSHHRLADHEVAGPEVRPAAPGEARDEGGRGVPEGRRALQAGEQSGAEAHGPDGQHAARGGREAAEDAARFHREAGDE